MNLNLNRAIFQLWGGTRVGLKDALFETFNVIAYRQLPSKIESLLILNHFSLDHRYHSSSRHTTPYITNSRPHQVLDGIILYLISRQSPDHQQKRREEKGDRNSLSITSKLTHNKRLKKSNTQPARVVIVSSPYSIPASNNHHLHLKKGRTRKI